MILKQSDHVCWKESDKTSDVDPNPEGAGLKLQSTEKLLMYYWVSIKPSVFDLSHIQWKCDGSDSFFSLCSLWCHLVVWKPHPLYGAANKEKFGSKEEEQKLSSCTEAQQELKVINLNSYSCKATQVSAWGIKETCGAVSLT